MPPKLYPRLMLAVLTGLNILNYIDRNALFAVQSEIKREFAVSDAQLGNLTFAFFLTYMIAAPLIGWGADRFPRKIFVVVGIVIWSGFTLLTWFAHDYWQLFFRHAVVGIGESSYVTIAPTLIADSFPKEKRGRMLSIFYIGLPFGSAAGYLVGGYFGHFFGWRAPFMVAGIPGLLLALVLWFLPEPPRGQSDEPSGDFRTELTGLWKNGAFITASLGMAMYTFAVGGIQAWMPTFLVRLRHLGLMQVNVTFGVIVLVNGIGATILGGWLADRLLKRYYGAYYTFPGIAMFVGVPFMVLAVYSTGWLMWPMIFAAVFFLLIGTGPTNTALVNSVNPAARSTALAVNVIVVHLLGDAISPSLIGRISDRSSLPVAFSVGYVAAAISGVVLVYGARYAPKLVSVAKG